jgi:peroxiredoxin (alkyl hydroperoxide reductase subunit C)
MYTVISANGCTYCQKAKSTLSTAGIAFQEFNLHNDHWVTTMMKQAGHKTVPQIFDADGVHIGGYTELIEYLSLT